MKALRDKAISEIDELKDAEDDDFDEIPRFSGHITQVSEKAIRIELDNGEQHWLPKSQLRVIGDDIYAAKWLLAQKGLS